MKPIRLRSAGILVVVLCGCQKASLPAPSTGPRVRVASFAAVADLLSQRPDEAFPGASGRQMLDALFAVPARAATIFGLSSRGEFATTNSAAPLITTRISSSRWACGG